MSRNVAYVLFCVICFAAEDENAKRRNVYGLRVQFGSSHAGGIIMAGERVRRYCKADYVTQSEIHSLIVALLPIGGYIVI